MNKCHTCQHPQKEAIEKAYLRGVPITTLSRDYGLGQSSIADHCQNHLPKRMVAAFQRRETMETLNMMSEFTTLLTDIKAMIAEFKEGKKPALQLKGTDTLIRLYQTMCQFASVFYQHQADERDNQQEDIDRRKKQYFQKRLKVLTMAELDMLQKLQIKMETMDYHNIILPDDDNFAALIKRTDKPFRLNGKRNIQAEEPETC